MARRRRRSRRLWIALALLAAAALGAVAWRLRRSEPASATRPNAPHEEIGEGDRRALRELLERKSAGDSE